MRENASLKAISILSMFFLPGAFVSVSLYAPPSKPSSRSCSNLSFPKGVFGSNFFNMPDSAPDQFRAAEQWWILPVTVVVSTAATFAIYFTWQRKRERKVMQAVDEETSVGLY